MTATGVCPIQRMPCPARPNRPPGAPPPESLHSFAVTTLRRALRLTARSRCYGGCRPTSFNDPSREAGEEGRPGRALLDAPAVSRIVDRIAHQLLEKTGGATDTVILGIPTRGGPPARRPPPPHPPLAGIRAP